MTAITHLTLFGNRDSVVLLPSCLTLCRTPGSYPPLCPGVCPYSCSLIQWCYLTISSSAALFSFCLQYFPASGSFPMCQLFASGGQSIGASASASDLLMNIQGWFPLGLTGLTCFQSKGISGLLQHHSSKHQFFGAQPSSQSNSHIRTLFPDHFLAISISFSDDTAAYNGWAVC